MRKAVLRMAMYTYTPISYFRQMTIREFLQTVKDYIEIMEETRQSRKGGGSII